MNLTPQLSTPDSAARTKARRAAQTRCVNCQLPLGKTERGMFCEPCRSARRARLTRRQNRNTR